MKPLGEILKIVDRWVMKDWLAQLTGEGEHAFWPRVVRLGKPTSDELVNDLPAVSFWVGQLHSLEKIPGVVVINQGVRSFGAILRMPAQLRIEAWDAALALTKRQGEFARHQSYAKHLAAEFPRLDGLRLIRKYADLSDSERDVLLRAAGFFRDQEDADFSGFTTRMIPIEGVSGKWLNSASNREFIQWLTGKTVDASVERSRTIVLAYLDPSHLAAGGRRRDSMTAGDAHVFPYPLKRVLIVENKDLLDSFPSLPGLMLIYGQGNAVTTLQSFPQLLDTPNVSYWGDMDVDGYTILHRLRLFAPQVRSTLMDEPSHDRYQYAGTNSRADGTPVPGQRPATDLCLTTSEQAVYARITDPTYGGWRRIEQERIPLEDAVTALLEVEQPPPQAD